MTDQGLKHVGPRAEPGSKVQRCRVIPIVRVQLRVRLFACKRIAQERGQAQLARILHRGASSFEAGHNVTRLGHLEIVRKIPVEAIRRSIDTSCLRHANDDRNDPESRSGTNHGRGWNSTCKRQVRNLHFARSDCIRAVVSPVGFQCNRGDRIGIDFRSACPRTFGDDAPGIASSARWTMPGCAVRDLLAGLAGRADVEGIARSAAQTGQSRGPRACDRQTWPGVSKRQTSRNTLDAVARQVDTDSPSLANGLHVHLRI